MRQRPPSSTLFPYTTLFRSAEFFRLTTPPWEVMRWANDKRLTYRLAGDLDIPHPWTYYPKGRDDVAALKGPFPRSEEHTSELQSRQYLVCRLLLEKKK